jgi:Repeat of Unknown Function (DUF347)
VATRPLGASFADYMAKPKAAGGMGWGDGPVAVTLLIAIFGLVAYLAATRCDVQGAPGAMTAGVFCRFDPHPRERRSAGVGPAGEVASRTESVPR